MASDPSIVLVIGTRFISDLNAEQVHDTTEADLAITMIGGDARVARSKLPEIAIDTPVQVIDMQKHILVIDERDWSLEHPVNCKGEFKGLSECPVQKAALQWLHNSGGVPPMPVGRYEVEVEDDGATLTIKGHEPVKIWGVCRHCDHAAGRHYPGITAPRLCDVQGCDCPGFLDRHDRYIVEQDTDPDPDGEEDPRATGESWVIVDTSDSTFHSDWFTQADAIREAQRLNITPGCPCGHSAKSHNDNGCQNPNCDCKRTREEIEDG